MNVIDASPEYAEGISSEVLQEILRDGVSLAVWAREPLGACEPAIRALLGVPFRGDWKAPAEAVLVAGIERATKGAATSNAAAALACDIRALSKIFGTIAGTKHPRVRLERVEDDGCALFHADTLEMRLLCTYAGPGTEWLDCDNLRREQLGTQGRTLEEANDAIVIDPANIRSIEAWHVAVFSGRARESAPALVHRSAPVSHPKDFRIRLCIDLPNDCGC